MMDKETDNEDLEAAMTESAEMHQASLATSMRFFTRDWEQTQSHRSMRPQPLHIMTRMAAQAFHPELAEDKKYPAVEKKA